MPEASAPELPGLCWTEGQTLVAKGGTKLRRWGSVQAACRILDDCERHVIYDLVAAKSIKGYKLKPHVPNSHWKIDLLSVWEHKQRQIHAA
ncbi:MAG: hypothetical protein EOP88_17130 [Verrucomicrobiaceae bacterium]|nr:MAG: hypothetical protein EOP88_17130 [Verrucomicrobiaceae bacterium]